MRLDPPSGDEPAAVEHENIPADREKVYSILNTESHECSNFRFL